MFEYLIKCTNKKTESIIIDSVLCYKPRIFNISFLYFNLFSSLFSLSRTILISDTISPGLFLIIYILSLSSIASSISCVISSVVNSNFLLISKYQECNEILVIASRALNGSSRRKSYSLNI